MIRRVFVSIALLAAVGLAPSLAAAQSFGIGPRFSFVRGNPSSGTPATRLVGGTVRMMTGPHTAIEGALDYRSYLNDAGTERTRETPMQGSLLLFLTRSALAPYVAGGIGMYSLTHDALDANGLVTSSTTEKKIGWHLGAGAEIRITKHAAFFADYRFRFVKFGQPSDPNQQPIPIPGSTIIPVLQNVKLSHEGSMWTSGMAFYF